jgi:hypothetical protein
MKSNLVSYRLPAYWASYLINGDASGLSDGEAREVDDCLEWIERDAGGTAVCVDCGDEADFERGNDWNGIGGATACFTFHVLTLRDRWRNSWGQARKGNHGNGELSRLAALCLVSRRTWDGEGDRFTALPYRLKAWQAIRHNRQPLA